MNSNGQLIYDLGPTYYPAFTCSPLRSLRELESALSDCAGEADLILNQPLNSIRPGQMKEHEVQRQNAVRRYGLPALVELDQWAMKRLGERAPVPLVVGLRLARENLSKKSAEAAAVTLRTTLRVLVTETQVGHLSIDDAAVVGCLIAIAKDVIECFEAVCSCDFCVGPNRIEANQDLWDGVRSQQHIVDGIARVIRKTNLGAITPIAITKTMIHGVEALSTDQAIESAGWFWFGWSLQSERLPELWPHVQAVLLRWQVRSRLFREIERREGLDAALTATARMT